MTRQKPKYPPVPGRAAVVRAGRDADRPMLIVAVLDGAYVLVADGRLRKIASPKKKKLKHLNLKPAVFPEISARLADGPPLCDADLRRVLDAHFGAPARDPVDLKDGIKE